MHVLEHNQNLLFVDQPDAIILYMGTKHKPWSTLSKITSFISEPKRVNPSSKDAIIENHPEIFPIENVTIKPEFRLILAILMQDVNLIASIESSLYEYVEKIEEGIPINHEIRDWISRKEVDADQFLHFNGVVSKACPFSRQNSLGKLCDIQSPTSDILQYLLSICRDELRDSVYREVARRGHLNPILLDACKKMEHSDYIQFPFLYGVSNGLFKENPLLVDLKIQMELALTKQTPTLKKLFLQNLQAEKPKASRSLQFLIISALFYPNELSRYTSILYQQKSIDFILKNVNAENYRSSLVHLLKFAEGTRNAKIIGIILALSTLGVRNSIDVDDNELIYTCNKSPMHFTMKYIFRRIFKQLDLWDKIGQADLTDQAITTYIYHISPEITEYNTRKIKFSRLSSNTWLKSNEVFSRYEDRLKTIINGDVLYNTILHLSKFNNFWLLIWLFQNFSHGNIKKVMGSIPFDSRLFLYSQEYKYPKKIKLLPIIKKGKHLLDNPNWTFTPSNNYEVNKALNFFYRLDLKIPDYLIKIFLDNMYYSPEFDIKLMQKYLEKQVFKSKNREFLHLFLSYIFNHLEKYAITSDQRIQSLNRRIILYLINWEQYSPHPFPDEFIDLLTALKITFQDNLEIEKVESFHIIEARVIANIYRIHQGIIPPLIRANIQYSVSKPNWDQMARHFLSLGLFRPNRDQLIDSPLLKIPKQIRQDSLGRIALVTAAIKLGLKNGFSVGLERVIVENMYMRGWNIDRSIDNLIPKAMSSCSSRLKAYFSAYLLIEKSDFSSLILTYARNIENYEIRLRVSKSLERFGTIDMWYVMAGSLYDDIAEYSIGHLQRMRISRSERLKLVQKMVCSSRKEVRSAGIKMLESLDIDDPNLELAVVRSSFQDTWASLLMFIISVFRKLTAEQLEEVISFALDIHWTPRTEHKVKNQLHKLMPLLHGKTGGIKHELVAQLHSVVQSRKKDMIQVLVELEEDTHDL